MANKKAVVAKLKSLAKTHGPVFVIASDEPKLANVEMSSFACPKCTTHFQAVAKTQPFCVTCGSDEVVEETTDESFDLPSDDSEMSAIQCSSCGTHNLLDDAVATAYSGQIHCVTCGEEIEYMADEMPSDETEVDVGEETVVEDGEDLLQTEEIVSADENEGDEGTEETTETETTETTEVEGDEGEDVEDDVSEETDSEEDESTEESASDKEVETATVKLLEIAKKGELSFELSGSKLTAYVGSTPVATLEKSSAGEHAGVIHSTSFAQAVKHTAKQRGVEKALAHYNFDLITVDVPVPSFVKEKAEAAIKGEREKIEAKAKALRDDFRHALQIASAGLNKAFFKNKSNALKAAFFDELAALGIRNPAKVIDKVFAAHGETYHATLLELAEEMMDKNPDVRNEIAKAIGLANYQEAQDEGDELSDDMGDDTDVSVEETLESAGVRRKVSQANVVTATIAEIKAGNNGRLFR